MVKINVNNEQANANIKGNLITIIGELYIGARSVIEALSKGEGGDIKKELAKTAFKLLIEEYDFEEGVSRKDD